MVTVGFDVRWGRVGSGIKGWGYQSVKKATFLMLVGRLDGDMVDIFDYLKMETYLSAPLDFPPSLVLSRHRVVNASIRLMQPW